ncbi:uncharacterized protein B0J16DRAFT_315392 [Fusarium flagelliforme]|uniref:uncharacterized protein n=1 Tax=Fusarium flagelliforme TaxID=2675880 RepID=UPI001E8CE9E6|nr:uncharacterized protein B0J16DRAFT_315392 [Fusarium flagelliforme]KAH7199117.1 hypothetical protein B0J16DRAFT_315392 [Fusarium flagelliforme]
MPSTRQMPSSGTPPQRRKRTKLDHTHDHDHDYDYDFGNFDEYDYDDRDDSPGSAAPNRLRSGHDIDDSSGPGLDEEDEYDEEGEEHDEDEGGDEDEEADEDEEDGEDDEDNEDDEDEEEGEDEEDDRGVTPPPGIAKATRAKVEPARSVRLRREKRMAAALAKGDNALYNELAQLRRAIPCLQCVRSRLAGCSDGDCWSRPGTEKCERCVGKPCNLLYPVVIPMWIYYIGYYQTLPAKVTKWTKKQIKELAKRRTVVDSMIDFAVDPEFPQAGDRRLP